MQQGFTLNNFREVLTDPIFWKSIGNTFYLALSWPISMIIALLVSILLTILTCGIYGIYWFIVLTDDASKANNDPNFSGVKAFLFTLITCGIYGIYWNYKIGKEVYEANQKNGINSDDNSIVYLILAIFGFSIVTYCIVQNDLNVLARKNNEA